MKLLRFAAERNISVSAPDGRAALTVDSRSDGRMIALTVRIFSEDRDTPLTLTAQGLPRGANAALLIHPWRIELWADGKLYDEEWPWGKLLLNDGCDREMRSAGIDVLNDESADDRANAVLRGNGFSTDCGISARDGSPAVIGHLTAQNGENPAEGWKPSDPGVFAGDCMPYTDRDPDGTERYHLLYLKDRRHHRSKWGKGAHQWAHLSTRDFRAWDLHPLAVSIDDPSEGSICTGSWLKTENGTQLLYYTIRPVDDSPAPLCRSVSGDGYHYRRDGGFRIVLSERYHGGSARDPKIVKAADGYHMFVTTSLMKGTLAGRGCLAHLLSEDGRGWRETEPIYVSPDESQPECPDYFAKDGWHYLVFSHHGHGQYRYSRLPFSEWQTPADPEIPCESVPKAAIWRGRIIFAGFHRMEGYGGTLTFTEAWQEDNGVLRFREGL